MPISGITLGLSQDLPQTSASYLGLFAQAVLKTADAKQAKARVAELNQTFTSIMRHRPMLMLHYLNPTLKLLNWLWLCLDISVQGFWVSSLLLS